MYLLHLNFSKRNFINYPKKKPKQSSGCVEEYLIITLGKVKFFVGLEAVIVLQIYWFLGDWVARDNDNSLDWKQTRVCGTAIAQWIYHDQILDIRTALLYI